jgi:hypothetical protein
LLLYTGKELFSCNFWRLLHIPVCTCVRPCPLLGPLLLLCVEVLLVSSYWLAMLFCRVFIVAWPVPA